MSFFETEEQELEDLKNIEKETMEAPVSRLGSPDAARSIHKSNCEADDDGAFNRMLVQQQMDFVPPHDSEEMENKGQSDRFNITTGEGPVIKNEAVSAYLDIYTTPKQLVKVPFTPEVDPDMSETWGQVMAEEFTRMERREKSSLANYLTLVDVFVTHGVAVAYFDDPNTMSYSVAGLDHFKFPRKTGITSDAVEFASAEGEYTVSELWAKIDSEEEDDAETGWNKDAVKAAIMSQASAADDKRWNNWESIQRDIKANEMHIDHSCKSIDVIHTWVKEADGKVSYYILTKSACPPKGKTKEVFLFNGHNFYEEMDHAMNIFAFSVGNGARLYTVRGLGYLIYQLCNAMDIMHCKLLDNARIGSSLMVQAANSDDIEDLQLIDFGGGVALPPTMKVVEQRYGQNLSQSLIPAIDASRGLLNRATGGLAAGDMMLNQDSDRRTKLEVSSQLDFINKLNSFGINLFYGPYETMMREKFRRAFSVRQEDKKARKRVDEMIQRCKDRGVPESVFKMIDFKSVEVTRIIGTGSRASRIMLMDQLQQMYSTWDAAGRKNFDYDYVLELIGPEKADRYAGAPSTKRIPVDSKIAELENYQMFEGDFIEPEDGENHLIHLGKHVPFLEDELQEVEEGKVDMIEWTTNHVQIYQHTVATLEMTVVHESLEPELNNWRQRAQQVGEIVINGLKMINKAQREGELDDPEAKGEGGNGEMEEQQSEDRKAQKEMQVSDMKHKQKLQQMMEIQMVKLESIKQLGEQQQVMEAQKQMAKVAMKDTDVQQEMRKARAKAI